MEILNSIWYSLLRPFSDAARAAVTCFFKKRSIFYFSKETERTRARKRISSVGSTSPEACSIVSSMKHTSPVVRLDFPIHLPLSSATVFFFVYLPLRLHIVCRRRRVRQSRISTHGTFALAYAIRAPLSSLF